MPIRKNVLWKVPVFCAAAGLAAFRAAVFLIGFVALAILAGCLLALAAWRKAQ